MSPPRVVRVLGKRYRYVPVDGIEETVVRGGSYGCLGGTQVVKGLIRYRVAGHDSSPDEEADTVLHELLHVVWDAADLDAFIKGGAPVEERIVDSLAPILLDALRRNPSLVEYLVEEASLDGEEEKAKAKAT